MHTFQIVTTDGRELGPIRSAGRTGRSGRGGPQPNLRVVERRERDGETVLVVEDSKPDAARPS